MTQVASRVAQLTDSSQEASSLWTPAVQQISPSTSHPKLSLREHQLPNLVKWIVWWKLKLWKRKILWTSRWIRVVTERVQRPIRILLIVRWLKLQGATALALSQSTHSHNRRAARIKYVWSHPNLEFPRKVKNHLKDSRQGWPRLRKWL